MKGLILALPVVALAIVKETGPHDAVRMNTGFELDSHTARLMRESEEGGGFPAQDYMVPYVSKYSASVQLPLNETTGNVFVDNNWWGRAPEYTWDFINVDHQCNKGPKVCTAADTSCTSFKTGDKCVKGDSDCFKTNSCGIHVHRVPDKGTIFNACERCATFDDGKSCPHFRKDGMPDPWVVFGYTAEKRSVTRGVETTTVWATSGSEVVDAGEDVLGQVMVVHAYDASRIACGPIMPYPEPVRVDEWVPYPGTTFQDNNYVKGTLEIGAKSFWKEPVCGDLDCDLPYGWYFYGNSRNALFEEEEFPGGKWSCKNGPAKCKDFPDSTCDEWGYIKNSCGLHVHQGTGCEDATQIGGHFFNRNPNLVETDGNLVQSTMTDPWLPVRFVTSSRRGRWYSYGKDKVNAEAGPIWGDINTTAYNTPLPVATCEDCGRVVVLHKPSGGRKACGVIKKPKWSTSSSSSMRLESNTMQRMDEMERRIAMMEAERK